MLRRVDKAFQAFFRRVKAGEKPGYPHCQGPQRYASFTYPQYGNGARLTYSGGRWGLLTLAKLGRFKVRMHRTVQGTIKTATIRCDGGDQWYICFSCEVAATPLLATDAATGVDRGLLHFATLADGSTLDNPRPLRHALKKLATAQQQLSRCPRRSQRRARARKVVARLHSYRGARAGHSAGRGRGR